MAVTINGVTVKMERDPEDWRRFRVTIEVESVKRPGLKSQQFLDPGKAGDARMLIRGVGAAGAVGAEYLCEKYRDLLDPSTCARDAIQAFGEEIRMIAELGKDLPKKLERLRQSSVLNDKEREVLSRMIHCSDKGDRLTLDEGQLVNVWLARIHESQL